MDQVTPLSLNNLPEKTYIATTGTIYVNPSSFARSVIDYAGVAEAPERPVYMVDLIYEPSGAALGLRMERVPLTVRPLAQLFGESVTLDPLNQESEEPKHPISDANLWTSFNGALQQLDSIDTVDIEAFLTNRLLDEDPAVTLTVKALLQ
jgi:hypothetical protein